MTADYNSTARALALPISPTHSPSPHRSLSRPSWDSRRSSSLGRRQQTGYARRWRNLKDRALRTAQKFQGTAYRTVEKMTLVQKIAAVVALVVGLAVGILFLVFNEKIFGWLAPYAAKLRNIRGGWLLIWFMTFGSAFPPLIGYSMSVTLAGFVYGLPNGWFIAASGTVIGSVCSFLASRTILSKYVHRLVAKDKRFAALSLTLKHDGIILLCMIRLCPLPYSISNGAMSTFPTVDPLKFALATIIATPKLFIHVFIGTRLADIGENGGKMDLGTKAINWASIIGGGIIGATVGWLIYRKTMTRAAQLEAEEYANAQATAPEDLAREYSDDADEQTAAETLRRPGSGTGSRGDDISLFENQVGIPGLEAGVAALADGEPYHDDFTEDEDAGNGHDVFRDGDGESGIEDEVDEDGDGNGHVGDDGEENAWKGER
ncbi:MAG: hypothetical protein M1819_002553 [Sarea resinae]|nr:MAG: hypothetical protein M1819_002553 [Sarea resinae]